IFKDRHRDETLIREWTARSAYTSFKAVATQRLAIPRIAGIVVYRIGLPNELIARVYSALRPNFFNERG
ncbi:MAG TPA: hypothetical protein VH189_15370, partial [Rhizomicrobium sp.]|nr:hypothetical protein [Rhizomicrobium sp.]